ncbi:MAG: T9SS type A sorting domain-containing protein [Candidatus Cloacimonetes bacterium]|nr:T9SS type A sorting domain-containing protein [Candidatus Cloacimonadota bacterium]
MADNQTTYPYLIPLIWQINENPPNPNTSPNGSARYNIFGDGYIPFALWGGSIGYSGQSGNYPNSYNTVANVPSPMTIDISLSIVGNTVNISAHVDLLNNITTTNNSIIFIMTNNFTGVQDPNYFASVVRYNQQSFNLTNAGDSQVFTESQEISAAWNHENLKIVVFVQSFSGSREIHQAAMVNMFTPDPIMGSPTNLEGTLNIVSNANHNVYLTWTAPIYAHTTFLNYKVVRNGVTIASPTVLNYRDFALEEHTTYTYEIVAVYSDGESEPSAPVVINVEELPPMVITMGAPRNLSATLITAGTDGPHVYVDWETPEFENASFLYYKVYRDGAMKAELNALNWRDFDISSFQTYSYYAIAVYNLGDSEPSDPYEIAVGDLDNPDPDPVLGAPRNLEGIFDGERLAGPAVILTWVEPVYQYTTLLSYEVYRDGDRIGDSETETYADTSFTPDSSHQYYVIAVYTDGKSEASSTIDVVTGPSSGFDNTIPQNMTRLINNHPNPFNPNTRIYFELHQASPVLLEVFNVRGQVIKTLVQQTLDSGMHFVDWNGVDENGQNVSSGIYFYRLQAGESVDTKRMVLMK